MVVSATSLLPAEAGAAEDRAVAILLTVIAGTIAGLLGWRWAGFGFGLGLGWFHLQVRELFGSAEETLAPLLPVYVIVTGGVAWLSAAVTDALRESWQASSILKSELAESERRQRVVQAISRVGAELSAHPSASDPVSHALTELCKALDLDVIIVRRNHDRRRRLSSDIESWITRSGSEAPAHGDGEFSWEALPYMRDRLASGEPCAFSSLDELPVPDRETLSSGIPRLESVLNIPVMDGYRWLGHAAFGSKTRGKPWTAEEVTSLSILTDMIASAWRREYQTNQLMMAFEARETALTAQRALTEGTNLLLARDSDDPLGRTLSLVMEALYADVAYIEVFETDEEHGLMSRPIEHLYRDPARRIESVTWPLSWSPVAAERYLAGLPSVFGSPEEEAESDPDRIELYEQAALAAECNYPIISDGEPIGFVGVGTFDRRDWAADDRSVMHSFALMLGSYLEREAAMRKLEDLVSAKDRFIGSVSHELRTPLAVVVGLAAELEEHVDTFTVEERDEFLGMIRRQSTEVSDIIDDLLVSTRIAETELTVINERFRLDELVSGVLRDLPLEITAKVAAVQLAATEVEADPLRTRQIVRNLITNANRYGGDRIEITVQPSGGRAVLAVADSGPGVPEERREAIFEAYHTSGGERIATGAIGLGLTVSRQLAQLMGGDVTYIHGEKPRFELGLRVTGPQQSPPCDGAMPRQGRRPAESAPRRLVQTD